MVSPWGVMFHDNIGDGERPITVTVLGTCKGNDNDAIRVGIGPDLDIILNRTRAGELATAIRTLLDTPVVTTGA